MSRASDVRGDEREIVDRKSIAIPGVGVLEARLTHGEAFEADDGTLFDVGRGYALAAKLNERYGGRFLVDMPPTSLSDEQYEACLGEAGKARALTMPVDWDAPYNGLCLLHVRPDGGVEGQLIDGWHRMWRARCEGREWVTLASVPFEIAAREIVIGPWQVLGDSPEGLLGDSGKGEDR